jgi:hypothetical protein
MLQSRPRAAFEISPENAAMDDVMVLTQLENLDRRLAHVEQILPTLATRDEMRRAIADAVAPLATREELRAAIAPLATKEELRLAIAPLATREEVRQGLADLRSQILTLLEQQRDDIRILADGVATIISRLPPR